ncbi:hypothetical protein LY78DRAFT_116437 [Colletotrichum sublineola]|nr:hypothetical protein LY78DRAFT_116437 [Colletotrichum sublineola]
MGFRRPFRTSPSPAFWELCVPTCWSGTSMRHANSKTWAGATGWQTDHTISKWGHPRWIPSLFLTAALAHLSQHRGSTKAWETSPKCKS